MKETRSLILFDPDTTTDHPEIPLFICRIWAGFPSPAENYWVDPVNLNELLIGPKKSNIKLIVAHGKNMELENIMEDDLVLVDTSIKRPSSGSTILCSLDGEPMIKVIRYRKNDGYCWLGTEMNEKQFYIDQESEFVLYGLITFSVTSHTPNHVPWIFDNKDSIDIHSSLISHPRTTFFALIDGDSMKDVNIVEGDMVVIDKLFDYQNDQIVLCCIDGEFTIKFLRLDDSDPNVLWLIPANEKFPKLKVTTDDYFLIWGQIKYSITPHNGRRFT